MQPRTLVQAVFLTFAVGATTPAWACCKDGDGGCWAAAFFTGGASCAATGAAMALEELKQKVERASADARARYGQAKRKERIELNSALLGAAVATSNARKEAQQAASDSGQIIRTQVQVDHKPKPQPASGNLLVKPAAPAGESNDHDTLLRQADREISRIAQEVGGELEKAAQTAMQGAITLFDLHVRNIDKMFEISFLIPLTGLLPMIPDPIAAGVSTIWLIDRFDSIVRDFDLRVMPEAESLDTKVAPERERMLAAQSKAKERAERARRLADAMKALNAQPSAANAQALRAMLSPPKDAPTKAPGGGLLLNAAHLKLAPGTLAGLKLAAPKESMAQTRQDLVGLSTSLRQMSARNYTLAPATLQSKAQPELKRVFAGKSPEQVKRAQDEMLASLRKRFGKDPQLMAQIERGMQQAGKAAYK
jgi:hypothetical protein